LAGLGSSVGTLGAATLRRFAGDACSSDGAIDLRFERRGGSKRWSLVDAPLDDPSNLSGVRTAGLTSFGKWSSWGLPCKGARRFAFGGVRKIATESGVRTAVRTVGNERDSADKRGSRTTWRAACGPRSFGGSRSEAGRTFVSGGVRKTAAESGVRTAVRTKGPATVSQHAPEGLAGKLARSEAPAKGLAEAWGWFGL